MPETKDIHGIDRGVPVHFSFNGQDIEAYAGESIAAALLRAGTRAMRETTLRHDPRGYYCGMGVCWECVVDVVGTGVVRACMHPVVAGLVVKSAAAHAH